MAESTRSLAYPDQTNSLTDPAATGGAPGPTPPPRQRWLA
jgi:hypothetical protein